MLDELDVEAVWSVYQELLQRRIAIPPISTVGTLAYRDPPSELPTTTDAQIELISRFMVAATAKDCSVMITLRQTDTTPDEPSTYPSLPVELGDAPRTVVRDLPGWEYSVTLVDLDPKPVEKIPAYYKLDRA